MYTFDEMALQVQVRRDELLRAAEQERLANLARGSRRFRFIGWRWPVIRFSLLTNRPESRQDRRRATLSGSV